MQQLFILLIIFLSISLQSIAMDLVVGKNSPLELSEQEIEDRFTEYVPFRDRDTVCFKNNSEKKECHQILKTIGNKDIIENICFIHSKIRAYDAFYDQFIEIKKFLKEKDKPLLAEEFVKLSVFELWKMKTEVRNKLINRSKINSFQAFIKGYNPSEVVLESEEQEVIDLFPEEKRKELQLKVAKGCETGLCCRTIPTIFATVLVGSGIGLCIAGIVLSDGGIAGGGVGVSFFSLLFGAAAQRMSNEFIEESVVVVTYNSDN